MKSKLNTLAPFLALILLGLAGSAFKYGEEFQTKAKFAASEEETARLDMEMAEVALGEIQRLPVPPVETDGSSTALPKDLALANGVGAMMALAEPSGVKIASISSVGGQTEASGTPVGSLFAAVPMTGERLFRADVSIKAEYKDFDGFRRFFSGLALSGVSVQAVAIRKTSFEATLRFFGV